MSYETASRLLIDPEATAEQLYGAAVELRGSFERAEHTIGLLPGDADQVMIRAYRAAADRGLVRAMLDLGAPYVSGEVAPWAPYPGRDLGQGVSLLRRADASGSLAGALGWIRAAYFARDESMAPAAMERLSALYSADPEDAGVQLLLGYFISQGYGYAQDVAAALPFFEAAAARGDADAAFELSILRPEAAADWTRRAADLGSARAQANLGGMYATGRGVEQDARKAVEWYSRAGDNGHARAAFIAGVMLLRGDDGLTPDPAAAEEQFATAEELGFDVDGSLDGMGITR